MPRLREVRRSGLGARRLGRTARGLRVGWRLVAEAPASASERARSARRAVLPADPAAADLGVRDAGVEGDRVGERGEGCGLGGDAGVVAQAPGELGEDAPVRADVAGARGAGADALQAAVGVGDGAVFLGVGLEREDDVGLGGGGVLEDREGDDEVGGGEGRFPGFGVGEVAQRVDAEEDEAPSARPTPAPRGSPRCCHAPRLAVSASGPGRRRGGSRPRAGRGRW